MVELNEQFEWDHEPGSVEALQREAHLTLTNQPKIEEVWLGKMRQTMMAKLGDDSGVLRDWIRLSQARCATHVAVGRGSGRAGSVHGSKPLG